MIREVVMFNLVDVTIERVKEDDEMAEYHVVMTEVQ